MQYTNVTDGRTEGQTPGDSKDRAYAKRRAVKIDQHLLKLMDKNNVSCF